MKKKNRKEEAQERKKCIITFKNTNRMFGVREQSSTSC